MDIELEDLGDATGSSRHSGGRPETPQNVPAKWRRLFSYTAQDDFALLVSSICVAIASGGISPALSLLLGRIFNQFTDFADVNEDSTQFQTRVASLSGYIAYLGLASFVLNGGRYLFWLLFGESQARNARLKIFSGLSTQSIAWFDTQTSGIASVISRAQTNMKELQLATAQPLGTVISSVTTALASIVIAFCYEWKLTFVIIAMIPVTAVVLHIVSKKTQPFIGLQQNQLRAASKAAQNSLKHRDSVKSFNGETIEANRYATFIDRAAKHFVVQSLGNAAESGFVRFVIMFSFVQGFWFGQHLVATGEASFGTVVTTFWACLSATQAVESILPQILVFEKGRMAGELLRSLSDTTSSHEDFSHYDTPRRDHSKDPVELSNVSFAYPTRRETPALRHFSCNFPGGEISYLVGKSGSGKSTIPQLLLRFYEPETGSISLGGTPLRAIDASWLRRTITVVEQESVLFAGSLKHNVELGKIRKSLGFDHVRAAVRFMSLQNTIARLPEGFRTWIGEHGNGFSGGQKQRIALARARLRDSPILILDESTSALDQSNRAQAMAAIRKWRRGRTTIIITHDWSQIQDEDFVCVMEGGHKLIEGTGRSLGEFFKQATKSQKDKTDNRHGQVIDGDFIPTIDHSTGDLSLQMQPGLGLPSQNQSLSSIIDLYTQSPRAIVPSVSSRYDQTPISTPISSSREQFSLHAGHHRPRPSAAGLLHRRSPERTFDLFSEDADNTQPHVDIVVRHSESSASTSSRSSIDLAPKPRPMMLWGILKTVYPSLVQSGRLLLLLGFLAAVLHAVAVPIFSWLFAKLLSTFIDASNAKSEALKYALSIIAIAIVDGVALFATLHFLERVGQDWIDFHRRNALRRILDQPKRWFNKPTNDQSTLLHVLDRCAEDMRSLLGRYCAFIVAAVVMMTISVLWSFAVCWKLTIVGLSACPVFFAVAQGFQISTSRMESLCNHRAEACAVIMHETFTKLKTVRALTLEEIFAKKHTNAVNSAFQAGIYRALWCGFFYGLSEALIILAEALVFYYGAVLVATRSYTVDQVLLIFSMLLFGLSNVAVLVGYIPQIEQSKETANRLLELSRLPPNPDEAEGSAVLPDFGSICIRHLSFSYNGRSRGTSLYDVSLTIPANKITALVGYSGSGKSTIAALLLRLLPVPQPKPGRSPCITVRGEDINTLSVYHLREHIALVPQQPVIFPASILENIAYALPPDSPYASLAAVEGAAKAAHIHDFVKSLPNGYNTLIGDGGTGLSGGQAQRIELARALVRKPRVLVLDEATSALDPTSADAIRTTISRLTRRRNMTVVLVTHAREMMEISDRIVMLEQGRVVEEGEYAKLLRKGGKLAQMLNSSQWH